MLRLTIRSGIDGRFLARVVGSGGRPFVLDFGDSRVIEDLVQRINRGFTVIRADRLVHVHPEDDDLIEQLAVYYLIEGALVALEEPTWPGRPQPQPRRDTDFEELEDDLGGLEDDPTEMLSFSDLPTVDEALQTLDPDARLPLPVAPQPEPAPRLDEAFDEDLALLPSVPEFER